MWVVRLGFDAGRIGCRGLYRLWTGARAEREGDLLDVLGGGGDQALDAHAGQTSEAGVAVAVQLLGVGEGAFDGFLARL